MFWAGRCVVPFTRHAGPLTTKSNPSVALSKTAQIGVQYRDPRGSGRTRSGSPDTPRDPLLGPLGRRPTPRTPSPPALRLLTLLEPSGALRSPPEPSGPRTPPERGSAAGPARRPSPTGPPLFPLGSKLIVFADSLSRWVEAIPLHKDPTSEQILDLFMEHVVCRYGVPRRVRSDHGSNFASRLCDAVLSKTDAAAARSPPCQ